MAARRPFVIIAIAVGSACVLAALETSQTWARFRTFGNPFDWLEGFRETLTVWLAVVARRRSRSAWGDGTRCGAAAISRCMR